MEACSLALIIGLFPSIYCEWTSRANAAASLNCLCHDFSELFKFLRIVRHIFDSQQQTLSSLKSLSLSWWARCLKQRTPSMSSVWWSSVMFLPSLGLADKPGCWSTGKASLCWARLRQRIIGESAQNAPELVQINHGLLGWQVIVSCLWKIAWKYWNQYAFFALLTPVYFLIYATTDLNPACVQ